LFGEPAYGFAFHGFFYWLLDVFKKDMVLVADVNGSAQRKGGRSQRLHQQHLFEEGFVSHVLADSNEMAFFAEIPDADKFLVVGVFEFFFEAYLACYNPDFDFSADAVYLVEAQLFARVLFEDLPVLHNIDQFISPETVVQPEFKNNLAPSRKLLVTPLRGVSL
jgi:hypothetical protein